MEIIALLILGLFGIIGFGAIFFTTFGTFIIFIGILLYAFLTGFSIISFKTLIIIFLLYLTGEVFEYLLVIVGAKKFGASNGAVVGAIIGGIVGAIVGMSFLGSGLIMGTFLGIFLGALVVELFIQRNLIKSLKAGTGGVLGRFSSILVKAFIAIIMLVIVITRIAVKGF